MTHNYEVTTVESRERISHEDFFNPRNRVTLIRVEDGKVFRVLFPIRSSPKHGDKIRLDDHQVQVILADFSTRSRTTPVAASYD